MVPTGEKLSLTPAKMIIMDLLCNRGDENYLYIVISLYLHLHLHGYVYIIV